MVQQQEKVTAQPLTPRLIRWEIFVVFAVSLGGSGLYALVSLIGSLTASQVAEQAAGGAQRLARPGPPDARPFPAPDQHRPHPGPGCAGVLPARQVAARDRRRSGLDIREPRRDLLRGAVLAAVIGGSGLGLYLAAYKLGFALNVVAEDLPAVWWRIPVLVLAAAQNGILEEILVVGYLLRRLDQLGVRPSRAIAISAVLRGSYHLYQGFGGFIGNAVMGVIFGYLYKRWGRVTPMIIAHTLIDAGAFIGYATLHGHVAWLP